MMSHATLAGRLAATRDEGADWQPFYDEFVGGLRAIGIGSGAPRVGERFPDLSLPDARGAYRTLASLLEGGPLVLSFNRGGWCPYCMHELRSWADALPALREAGGALAVVTGEVGGRAARLEALFDGGATLLCDVDHGAALASGLAFHIGPGLQRRYDESGLHLADLYGSNGGFLPVPATFVIDPGGIVRYAFADPDFRVRAEPDEVVAAVAKLRS